MTIDNKLLIDKQILRPLVVHSYGSVTTKATFKLFSISQ